MQSTFQRKFVGTTEKSLLPGTNLEFRQAYRQIMFVNSDGCGVRGNC